MVSSAAMTADGGTHLLHVDMDAFFASVEALDNPALRGLPFVVGGDSARGVVSTASYEARRYGVRSAMPVAMAKQLCSHLVVVPGRHPRYRQMSRNVMEILRSFTPLVEQLSIDEAFLDVTGARKLYGSPMAIARRIRADVRAQTGLTCSVGVAATKHVAKIASGLAKPDGVKLVPEQDTQRFLDPLDVGVVWGVGAKARSSLAGYGIRTIGDLRRASPPIVERVLGTALGRRAQELAHGIDPRPVVTHRIEKSISHEETFVEDIADRAVLRAILLRLADQVAMRLRRAETSAAGVSVKLRYSDFRTVSRSRGLPAPSDATAVIAEAATELFDTIPLDLPVRLIGVRADHLDQGQAPLALWDDSEASLALDEALDTARDRFGLGSIMRASTLGVTQRRRADREV